MIGYYFSTSDKRLRYDDKRTIRAGRTHKISIEANPLELCGWGLHASERPLDALQHAPGPYLWLVELKGELLHGTDKSCATERRYLAGFNAESLLRRFARQQALINIEKIQPWCMVEEYALIHAWLTTGEERLRSAAWSAARSAWSAARSAWSAESAARSAWSAESAARSAWSAESAAWSAARSAESATRSATRSAAWSVARSAAESAAWSVARSAAESAAWSAAEFAAESVAESAAWSAAESAARSAARSAANTMLIELIYKELNK